MYGLTDWQVSAIEAQALPRALADGERIVYALLDPRDSSIRYVGQTKTPHQRLMQHVGSPPTEGPKRLWLDELAAARLVPTMQICERVQGARDTLLREAETIRRLLGEGLALVNDAAQEQRRERAIRRMRGAPAPLMYTATYRDTVSFRGRPITLVSLSNGGAGVIFRTLCEALEISPEGQVRRIERKAMLRVYLIHAMFDTPGGPQQVRVLRDKGIPMWLATIDLERTPTPHAETIAAYQDIALDMLGRHAEQEGARAWALAHQRQ